MMWYRWYLGDTDVNDADVGLSEGVHLGDIGDIDIDVGVDNVDVDINVHT